MHDNPNFEDLRDRLFEFERGVQAHLLSAEAAKQPESDAESCGAWCQVKRRAGAIRLAPRYN